MIKFVKDLTKDADGIRLQRALNLGAEATDEQTDLIRGLEKQKRDLENKLLDLTDLSPETTIDLKPGKNFSAKAWVHEIQRIELDILEIDIQLDVARKTTKKWFTDESAE